MYVCLIFAQGEQGAIGTEHETLGRELFDVEGGVRIVYAESSQAGGVVGLLLALIVEVELAHGDAVALIGEEADVLLVLQLAGEFVGVVVVAYEHGVALERVEEVARIGDEGVGGGALDGLQLPHAIQRTIDEVAVAGGKGGDGEERQYVDEMPFHVSCKGYLFLMNPCLRRVSRVPALLPMRGLRSRAMAPVNSQPVHRVGV